MILPALVQEFRSLFAREPRAPVALWFDEKREFERLLPKLEEYLAAQVSRLVLLRYDSAAGHGQLWLKGEVHGAGRALPEPERGRRRHVLYLPFPPERLDGPDEDDDWSADFLLEYRYRGVTWLLDGKRPTLFSFLRKLRLPLPTDAREQRRLWEGGRDSFLARVVARHADRGADFWDKAITAAWAQEQLLGDLEQCLLELAADPQGKWEALQGKELLPVFRARVQERFGFQPSPSDPREWVGEFARRVALTETFQAYGEPADFPFGAQLPEPSCRPHCTQFLRRWLKDVSARGDYHSLIRREEAQYDLTDWARRHTGSSYAFPHLTRDRWQTLYRQFRAAAGQRSAYLPFLTARRDELAREDEFTRASPEPVCGFDLLRRLADLVLAVEEARARIQAAGQAEDLVGLYVQFAGRIDGAHWRLCADAMKEPDLEDVVALAHRAYGDYLLQVNGAFFEAVRGQAEFVPGGAQPVSGLAAQLWSGPRPFAVIIVDALRYDCAVEIQERLALPPESLAPVLACIPSRTWVGMTSLLPLGDLTLSYQPGAGEGRLRAASGGWDFSARADRLAFLRERTGAVCREVDDVDASARAPDPLPDLLVVFGHETIDQLGHDNANDLLRHLELEVDRICRLVRKLHAWGYPEVHLLTDHGFVITSDQMQVPETPLPADQTRLLKARYAILNEGAVVEAKTYALPLDPSFRLAVPAGMACFKKERSFSHGGVCLQEVIIPHLVSRQEVLKPRIGVRVDLPTYEVKTHAVKVTLVPDVPRGIDLFHQPQSRTVAVDLLREGQSVLARPVRKEVTPDPAQKVPAVLMLDDKLEFAAGDSLDLVVRDVDNQELLSPPGLKLTVARSL